MSDIGISIIIPTFNYSNFIGRAIASVYGQTHKNYEIIIIDDGSTDNLEIFPALLSKHPEITVIRNENNMGMGYCMNLGLDTAKYGFISYLPADDIYFSDHLETLLLKVLNDETTVLAYSGLKFNYLDSSYASRSSSTQDVVETGIQPVQVLHRKTDLRWTERNELVTDDIERMYWRKLRDRGRFMSTGRISCEWVSHPLQRHKIISELHGGGGIYRYKEHYGVKEKIRFQSRQGNYIDETSDFMHLSSPVSESEDGLKILLVGELAYNADRICALEKRGHKLYGLWMQEPFFYNTIGPLPFGNVIDISHAHWKEQVEKIKPDLVYGLLNHPAVPIAHSVLSAGLKIPFFWHFKESPFYCRQSGTWDKLIDLFQKSDGQIYINRESEEWFGQFLHRRNNNPFVLDGDLPNAVYYGKERSPLLSDIDGEVHTVIAGRPFGLNPDDIKELIGKKIHLHLYGDYNHGAYRNWLRETGALGSGYLHLHNNCNAKDWTKEFSKYDAGWLHIFESNNFGELQRAEWHDLNFPARLSTLAAAGLPMIQRNNSIHTVASESLTRSLDIGVFFSSIDELYYRLNDKAEMKRLRDNCWRNRDTFTFDYHIDRLISFFRETINTYEFGI